MNYNRFIKVLRWNIISSKKQLFRKTIGISLALLFIIIVNCGRAWTYHADIIFSLEKAARISVVGLGFALFVCASRVCWNMATKTDFFNYAMLPATNAEKFAANVTYQFLVHCLMMLIAIVAADVVQVIISLIAGSATTSFTFDVFKRTCYFFDTTAIFIFFHALYTFGGTFFRKNHFLYTSLFIAFSSAAFSILSVSAFGALGYWISQNGYTVSVNWLIDSTTAEVIGNIVLLILAAALYYLAFLTFRRTQIINNRFFN